MLHSKKSKRAFTLVELIVVIAILVVLSTVGFVGYSGYTSTSRDASRGSDLKNIYQALKVSEANVGVVPEPDSAMSIYSATGVTLSKQGIIGESVRKAINLESGGRDPKESTGYTYLRFKDKKSVQLLALFENEGWEARLAMKDIPGVGIPKAYAADYTDRYPVTSGKKLGVLIECTSKNPLNEASSYTASGVNLGLTSINTGTGVCVIGNTESNISEVLSSTGVLARVISPSSIVVASSGGGGTYSGIWSTGTTPAISCLAAKTAGATTDGLYWIKPDASPAFQAYCDMTTDGGGWTLAARIKWDECTHMDIAAVGTVTSKTQAATAKFSDTIINGFADRTVYRVTYDTPNYSIYLNALSGDQFAANGKPSFQSKDTFVGTIWYGPVDWSPNSHVGPVTFASGIGNVIPSWNMLVWWYTGCNPSTPLGRGLGSTLGWDTAWALWIK